MPPSEKFKSSVVFGLAKRNLTRAIFVKIKCAIHLRSVAKNFDGDRVEMESLIITFVAGRLITSDYIFAHGFAKLAMNAIERSLGLGGGRHIGVAAEKS